MLIFEEDTGEAFDKVIEQYEDHFGEEFPYFEYIYLTQGNGYDVSIEGEKRLQAFIEERIKTNTPVPIPDGYQDRIY